MCPVFKPLNSAYVSSSLKKLTRNARYVFANSFTASASVEFVSKTATSFFIAPSSNNFENTIFDSLENDNNEKNNCTNDNKTSSDYNQTFFELFGIKLFNDDILIILLLLFLYKEGVRDQSLFLSLIFRQPFCRY